MKFADLIDPYAPATGPPPRTLAAFFLWGIRGTFPVIVVASILAGGVGTLEAFTAVLLGRVIDAVLTSGADRFMADNFWLFAMLVGFFVGCQLIVQHVCAGPERDYDGAVTYFALDAGAFGRIL